MSKTPNNQIVAYNAPDSKPSCNRCGSTNFRSGAGRKPEEESLRCSECSQFLCYRSIEKLKKRRKPGLEPISAILARLEFGGEV